MSDAVDLLKQRLAKGEIDLDEFHRLKAVLSEVESKPKAEEQKSTPPPSRSAITDVGSKVFRFGGYAIGGFIVYAVGSSILQQGDSSGLNAGDISGSGDSVSFTISNTKDSSGDVVFWVEQNDLEMCPRKFRVNANFNHRVQFSCPNLKPGRFSLQYAWASSDSKRSNIAQRVSN